MRVALALAGTVALLVALAIVLAGPDTYAEIATADRFEEIPFRVPGNVAVERRQSVRYDVATRVALHSWTMRYVLGIDGGTPRDPTTRDPLFDAREQGHLADVRSVFTGARVAAVVGLILVVAILARARRRARLIRDAALIALGSVTVIGLIAAFAFEPAFLAFHLVFFPQGNFLFDPETSALLALYPDPYWYGVTLRIAGAFVMTMAAVALIGHVSDSGSAIVTRR